MYHIVCRTVNGVSDEVRLGETPKPARESRALPSGRIRYHGRFATPARTGTVREMEAADWASLSDQESTESLRLNGVRDFGQGAQEHVRQ
jgi:hypothetical protein